MQAMDEEPEPEPHMPNDMSITSDTTRLDVVLWPPGVCGPRVDLVLNLAMMECHNWVGIGGRTGRVRRPRRLRRKVWLALDDDYLRSDDDGGDDCRRRIGGAIEHSLRKEEEFRCLTPAYWDQAVPVGLERAIAVAVAAEAQRGGSGTFVAFVDIRVQFEFVYSEPKALMLARYEKDGGGVTWRSRNGGDSDDERPSCSICFEEMWREADEVTDLPGCTHSFHRCCIAEWFHKASTCPVCRRDQLHYLPPDYWDLHGKMTNDPYSLRL